MTNIIPTIDLAYTTVLAETVLWGFGLGGILAILKFRTR